MLDFCLTIDEIREAFAKTVDDCNGKLWNSDHHSDVPRMLILRGLLPSEDEVVDGDSVQQGIALKVTPERILVCPFMLREICQNGMVIPIAFACVAVDRTEHRDWAMVKLQEGMTRCCHSITFSESMHLLREMRDRDLASSSGLIGFFQMNMPNARSHVRRLVAARLKSEEPTDYGLMNAITSVARDSKNVAERWELEMLGGKIATGAAKMPADVVCPLLLRAGVRV